MDNNEFLKQQHDAVLRMREMKSRSTNPDISNKSPVCNKNKTPPQKAEQKKAEYNNSTFMPDLQIPFLDKIFNDADAMLIIGLLLILMNEKADKRLLFALVYILL